MILNEVPANRYRGYRFPEEIISQCVWLYFNLSVSLRDVELMMAGAAITVLPVLLLFFALQRYYMQGLLVGSVKG